MWKHCWLLGAAAAVSCLHAQALDNGLALVPPMGFNTWNAFGCDIHETAVKELVDTLVSSGLRDAGYVYFNLDDCWSLAWRSAEGKLQANPHSSCTISNAESHAMDTHSICRFPSGMKSLADYVHSKGLLFGIYGDAGRWTCAGRAGSIGHEADDAQTFADWGVDYLKYDNCGVPPGKEVQHRYSSMRDALNATGRPILFSMCEWGVNQPEQWGVLPLLLLPEGTSTSFPAVLAGRWYKGCLTGGAVGNSWRTSADITKTWQSVIFNLDSVVGLSMHAGPGAWNDPDMLQVGNSHELLHHGRERVHFGLWALMKAPLLIGADLRSLRRSSLKLLKSPGVVAINQDAMGVAGDLIYTHGSQQVYAAPLSGGRRAVALVNKQPLGSAANITLFWSMIGYPESLQVAIDDAFLDSEITGCALHNVTLSVPPDDIVLVVLRPLQGQICSPVKHQAAQLSTQDLSHSSVDIMRDWQDPSERDCVHLNDLNVWRPWHHGFFRLG